VSVSLGHIAVWGLDWLVEQFNDKIVQPLITFFSYLIGGILYGIQIGLFYIMDAIQMVVRKISGLPAYNLNGERTFGYYVDGVEHNDDLVMAFLESETVRDVFISVLVAAIFLLFISTVIAILKSEVDLKSSNAKGPIFGNAIKSIVYFFMVPVVCYVGIIVSNLVLKTLDGATSRGAVSFSAQIFYTSSFNCNRILEDKDFAEEVLASGIIPNSAGIKDVDSDANRKALAKLVDEAFKLVKTPEGTATIEVVGAAGFSTDDYTFSKFDIKDYRLIFYYYNVLAYNYLIGYASGFIVLGMLLNLLIGVIRRVFELVVLFVVSPAIVALMPLDGGDKFKTWKDNFIKRVFAAYGPIIGLNLCFMVLEVLQGVTLF